MKHHLYQMCFKHDPYYRPQYDYLMPLSMLEQYIKQCNRSIDRNTGRSLKTSHDKRSAHKTDIVIRGKFGNTIRKSL